MKKNLKDLLDEYEVEIPALQRNYVHGASTSRAKEIREHFMDEFVKLLQGDKKTFDLNFIYGENRDGKIVPVDGQQRLTTLWLLAAFIVNHYCNDEENTNEWRRRLEKFCYAGRPLAAFASRCIANSGSGEQLNLLGLCQDITTGAMAETIKTIANYDEKLKLYSFDLLECALERVTFKFEVIRQSADETYIKMNARGKTLTQWENFKGKFAELLSSNDENGRLCERWESAVEEATDNFIELQSENAKLHEILPDDSFFALVARILLYECKKRNMCDEKSIEEHCSNIMSLTKHRFDNQILPFVPFDEFKHIIEFLGNDDLCVVERIITFIILVVEDRDGFYSKNNYPYWKIGRPLWETVFKPGNEQERDFGLILYEYVNEFDNPESVGIRLITNIIENSNSENRIRDCLKFFTNGSTLYGKQHIDSDIEQVEEEIRKADIYGESDNLVMSMQRLEEFMHGRIRVAILPYQKCQNDTIARRFKALNWIMEKWNDAIEKKDITSLQTIVSIVMMAMPYWPPKDDSFEISTKEYSLRNLLHMSEMELSVSLLDYLAMEMSQKSPEDILKANPASWDHSDHANVPWRRDWQSNLLWMIESEEEKTKVWEHTLKYHIASDYFFLFDKAYISSGAGATPINDYRFDFIRDADLRTRLEAFYESAGADNRRGMRMNNTCAHETMVNGGKWLFFYPDNVALDFINKDGTRSRRIIQFDDADDKSIFSQEKLKANADKFFQKILDEIQRIEE